MKPRFAVCTMTLALLFAVSSGEMDAQSATPAPTAAPADVPTASGPMPTATAAASPVKTEPTVTKDEKPKRSAEEKAARKAERLRKYDTNRDGKLDEKERAAMHADQAKASPTP